MKTTLLLILLFISPLLIAQNVYIPDANFKAYLVARTDINTNNDTEIQLNEASAYNGDILCINLNITDLTGIETFTALTILNCASNQLTNLNLTQNTGLTWLSCRNNQLTNLDVSNCIALEYIDCSSNQLAGFDVRNCIALEQLRCFHNELTSLDCSQNTVISILNCRWNLLSCLNIKNGNNNNLVSIGPKDNPLLTCIQVDDATYSTENWTSIDPQMYFSENCDYPSDCFTANIDELTTSKNLIQILDLMGRETTFKPNTPLIYVYDDGSTERVFTIEE